MLTQGISSLPSLSQGACYCLGSAAELGEAVAPPKHPPLEAVCWVNADSGWRSDRVLLGGLRCPGRGWQGRRWRGWWPPLRGHLLLFVSETPCPEHPKIATRACNTPSGTCLPGVLLPECCPHPTARCAGCSHLVSPPHWGFSPPDLNCWFFFPRTGSSGEEQSR